MILLVDHDDPDSSGLRSALESEGTSVSWVQLGRADIDIDITVRPAYFEITQSGVSLNSLDFAAAHGVFYRRWNMAERPLIRSSVENRNERRFSEREWTALLWHAFQRLADSSSRVPWANPPAVDSLAKYKLHWLSRAEQKGFSVPAWIASTSLQTPAPGNVVAKAINSDEQIDAERSFRTTAVPQSYLEEHLYSRASCPGLLQEAIQADYELRIYHVCGSLVTIRLQNHGTYDSIDLRYASPEDLEISLASCPLWLGNQIIDFCRATGLNFAAFDILFARGNAHLVDITPNATWSGYEELSGAPIAREIARALIDKG